MDKIDEKVNLLTAKTKNFQIKLGKIGINQFQTSFINTYRNLESHDLIGLKILSNLLNQNIIEKISDTEIQNLRNELIALVSEIEFEFSKDLIPPTQSEELFLNLSYNKFFDIVEEVYDQNFWSQSPQYRLGRISQAFSIYSEILNYAPFKGVLSWVSKYRPPMESEISGPLFKFIRNVLAHFPFYDSWDEIWISKDLVNWCTPNQSIDKFLEKFTGKSEVKYRFKEQSKIDFTYVAIKFPKIYNSEKIYLKDIIQEEQGVKFAIAMMVRILNTQIESIKIN